MLIEEAINTSSGQGVDITIIKPKKGWQVIDIKELIRYRDLFLFMTYRDIKVLYKQTILGFAWAILNPLFNMLVFGFLRIMSGAKFGPDNIPYLPFLYAGLIPWTFFSTSLNASSQSLINASQVITKVYFPRLVVPFSAIMSKLVDFALSFAVLIILMFAYHITPNINLLYLPLLIVLMVLCASGIGLWFSALAIQYRDIKYGLTFMITLIMFLTPVLWSADKLAKLDEYGHIWKTLYGLYPMAGIEVGFRSCLLGYGEMPWEMLILGTISSIIVFIGGAFYFQRMEKVFADVA